MRETDESLSIIHAAEAAAEAGNYLSAESLLREAARLQEASLGPRHPDLANTLNNLGIVCEMTGKPDDAEQYFRRAVSIARTSLAPDHPFVTTSQKNLRDFCEARGRKVELPAPAPAPPPALAPAPAAPDAAQPTKHVTAAIDPEPDDSQLTPKTFFTRWAVGALGPIAMLMVVLAAGLPRLGAPEAAASRTIAIESPRDVAPPPTPAPTEAGPDDASAAGITPAPTAARPVVVRASLCGDLDDWMCDPADRPVPSGPLFFYTQITSTGATTIQHRWYQDDRLHRAVELRVQANRTAGYRTFSRNVMTSDSAGNWKVEVRSEDGALLHEEHFAVR